MGAKDLHGLELTGASTLAAEKYEAALDAYLCYFGDAITPLEEAIADSPAFVMAHVLKGYITVSGANEAVRSVAIAASRTADGLAANERERAHVAALRHLTRIELKAAGRLLEDVSIAYPQDILATHVGQVTDFSSGQERMLLDRIARLLPVWSSDMPHYHAVMGMLSFGLCENSLYERGEAAGRLAIGIEPRNNWAQHGLAHVLEMQGRRRDGVKLMREDNTVWHQQCTLGVHNWWHLALFHLGLGEIDEVLALYDGPLYGAATTYEFDMVDASSLLWRVMLQGGDVGDRWSRLADNYASEPRGLFAFADAHAMMAFAATGRDRDAQIVLDAQIAATQGSSDNAYYAGEVGLPVCQALYAFGHGDYRATVELLRNVRSKSARFGGSRAQRDFIDLTLIAAAQRCGESSLERALLAERA